MGLNVTYKMDKLGWFAMGTEVIYVPQHCSHGWSAVCIIKKNKIILLQMKGSLSVPIGHIGDMESI